jgi:ribosome-associated protein
MSDQNVAEKALALAHTIVEGLDEKKGKDILLLDLIGVCSFTDYFVICTGATERTLKALVEAVDQKIEMEFEKVKISAEGRADSGWVLIDYGDVVVHLFSPEMRDYYQLEELWREGRVLLRLQ